MDFSDFDTRNYKTVSVEDGYGEWAGTYEETVLDQLDRPLLSRIKSVEWAHVRRAADLACGTGRTGAWLSEQGVRRIDGVDLSPEMIKWARAKGLHAELRVGDVLATPLESAAYDLVIIVLADEHIEDLRALYRESARLLAPNGKFLIIGYHPHFLMLGIPTHFHRPDGEPVAVKAYVHSFSDHVCAAHASGWVLSEMHEHVVDDACIAAKPKWEKYLNHPISFAMVWHKA